MAKTGTRMLADKLALIREEVEEGTGAGICLEEEKGGVQTGINLWFADLERSHSPIVNLRPTGLSRFRATLTFGNFAGQTIRQMQNSSPEERQLARALVATLAGTAEISIGNKQTVEDWVIDDGSFTITAEKRNIENRFGNEAVTETCRDLVIPVLAAMAELYGYDAVEESYPEGHEALSEGAVKLTAIRRRERNPRNRLLCLRIHGKDCKICCFDPAQTYADAGNIIEVHHLQPLSVVGQERAYDPAADLIPLCPNCHRAVHTRRPVPWTPADIAERLAHE